MSILVYVVSCGEGEYQECITKLMEQKGILFEVREIKDMENLKAHNLLYNSIMENASKYDYFVKIDADMILASDYTLYNMIKTMANDGDIDHGIFSVLDWYSMQAIMGMHVFSSNCRWDRLTNDLFVDPDPSIPGNRKYYWDRPSPVALHSPNPTNLQAFSFGYHRTLKILQLKSKNYGISRAYFQLSLLKSVYLQTQFQADIRRQLALFGANTALLSGQSVLRHKDCLSLYNDSIDEFLALDRNKRDRVISGNWGYNPFCRPYSYFIVRSYFQCLRRMRMMFVNSLKTLRLSFLR